MQHMLVLYVITWWQELSEALPAIGVVFPLLRSLWPPCLSELSV